MRKGAWKRMDCLKTRETSGFTLVEVMIAMAIIALTAVVLLDQRMAIVRDAGRARDMRTVWILASQKMAELELDKTLWTGLGSQSNGDFGDVNPDYTPIQWEYQIVRESVEIPDPTASAAENANDKKKRELYRLTLTVRSPGNDDPILLEGEFTVTPPKPEGSGTTDDPSKTGTPDPSKPPDSAVPPATGGLRK